MSAAKTPIGRDTMDAILGVTIELKARIRPSFEPYEGVYRLSDFAEYVSEADWDEIWSRYPDWWHKAWMLADNGQFTAEQISRLTPEQVEQLFESPAFEPEYAFYTDAGEDGLL